GWTYCFALGAFGMLISLALFYTKRSFLLKSLIPSKRVDCSASKTTMTLLFPLILISCALFGILLSRSHLTTQILEVFSILIFAGLIIFALFSVPLIRNRVFALLLFCFYYMVWAACFFQTGGSLTLFIERNVDRHLFGTLIPTAAFFSIEGFFIVALAPLF